MEHTYEYTHPIDTQEQDMENNEVEQDDFYEDINDDLITEEEIKNIHPDLNHNFPYPTMNSGIMSINHNYP